MPSDQPHEAVPGWVWWCGAAISRYSQKTCLFVRFFTSSQIIKMTPFSFVPKGPTFSFLNYCASTDDRRTNDATCGPQEWVADWITALGGNPERTLTAAAGPSPRDPYRHSLAMRPPRKARPFCFLNYIFWLYVKKRTKRHVFCDSARSPHRTTKPSRDRLCIADLKTPTKFVS